MLWLIWVSCTIWKSRILSMGGKKCHLENTNPFISPQHQKFQFSKLNFSTVFEMWSGPIFTEFSVRKGQNSHLVNAHPQFSKELLSSAQMIWNIFWEHVQCRQPNLTANIYLLERGETFLMISLLLLWSGSFLLIQVFVPLVTTLVVDLTGNLR